jgi:hypothetical protein
MMCNHPLTGTTAVPADFHVAVAHSGGGKRAFFNSLGQTELALY